jgi:gas vesicle protein
MANIMLDFLAWSDVIEFFNSNFASSLMGALAGAFAGAVAAQRIADRAKQREALLEEIRSTNAAIIVAFTVCNAGLALKKQFTKDIYETYKAKKAELHEFNQRRTQRLQPADLPFEFQADLRTLQMPAVPIDVLRTQLYEKISAPSRPLAMVAALAGSIASLANIVDRRNTLIEKLRNLEGSPQLAPLYFGMPYGPGHVSTEFADTIESLHSVNDDVIFFSDLLGRDLVAHGKRILGDYHKIAKVKEEKIHSVEFSDAREQGLMPDAAHYADWLKGSRNTVQPNAPADAGVLRRLFRRFSQRR